MSEYPKAFDKLPPEDQFAAVDVAIASALIELRAPSVAQELYKLVASEFAVSRGLAGNIVRYALRDLGAELYGKDWTLTVRKRGQGVETQFDVHGKDGQAE